MGAIKINQGTELSVVADQVGTVYYPVMKLDMGAAGGTNPFTGTFVTNQNSGTINSGTVDSISQLPPNYFTTTVTSGTSALGTIKPAVAGSAIFVTDMIISVGSASNVVIGMGGTSTPFIGTLSFAANGGMTSNFRIPGSVTSGSALVYQQSANGPLSIYCAGFVR